MRAYTQPSPGNYARCIISLFVGIRGSIGIRAKRNLSFSIRINCKFFGDKGLGRTWLFKPFSTVLRDESKFMENRLAIHHPSIPRCSLESIKVGGTRLPLCIPLANLFVVLHVDYLSEETLYRIGKLVVLGKTDGSRYVSSIRSERPVIFITITNSTSLFAVDWWNHRGFRARLCPSWLTIHNNRLDTFYSYYHQ